MLADPPLGAARHETTPPNKQNVPITTVTILKMRRPLTSDVSDSRSIVPPAGYITELQASLSYRLKKTPAQLTETSTVPPEECYSDTIRQIAGERCQGRPKVIEVKVSSFCVKAHEKRTKTPTTFIV
jgi:hypothetical protein